MDKQQVLIIGICTQLLVFMYLNISLSLICIVFQVGWVRADTKAILTLYDTIITHDPRIKLTGDFATTFNLHISNIQKEDRGVYMCQINTDPMIYQRAQLDVNIPPDIDGARTSGTKNHIFKGKKGEKKKEKITKKQD